MGNLTLITSEKNWLEQPAIDQLRHISTLPGVRKAVGLPDLHPGKTPVGAAIITEGIIYPHLVGNDIGCGMSLFMTDLEKKKLKIERLAKKAAAHRDLNRIALPEDAATDSSPLGSGLGTIGGGNHFAELQAVETVYDEPAFQALGYDPNRLMLLVHSGSRGYGQAILAESIMVHQAQHGLPHPSEAAQNYLQQHDRAVYWAGINRELIAYRFLKALDLSTQTAKLHDSCHNSVTIREQEGQTLFIHRKGASPADAGGVIIPGSRGALTYLVKPTDNTELAGYSLAHGAGRKWPRSLCKGKLGNKYTMETITSNKFKGRIVCRDRDLLFEEVPEAYKNIDTVIQSLLDFGLITVIATFKPQLTYKA